MDAHQLSTTSPVVQTRRATVPAELQGPGAVMLANSGAPLTVASMQRSQQMQRQAMAMPQHWHLKTCSALVWPSLHTLPHKRAISSARRSAAGIVPLRRPALPATAASTPSSTNSADGDATLPTSTSVVMVWFKVDLRVDDHGGLEAALKMAGETASIIPVYCLDPNRLHHLKYTPAGAEVLVNVLCELQAALRERGNDLVILTGKWEDTLPAMAQAWGVHHVVAQLEVETMLAEPAQGVAAALEERGIEVTWWRTDIWPPASFNSNARAWKASRPPPCSPLPPPAALPPLPELCSSGRVLEVQDVRELLSSSSVTRLHETPALLQELGPQLQDAESGLAAQQQRRLIAAGRDWLQRLAVYLHHDMRLGAASSSHKSTTRGDGAPNEELLAVVRDGVAISETPAAPGASFPAMFSAAMALGALSRRRVYTEAQAVITAAGGSDSVQTAQAASITAESGDFHWELAVRNDNRPPDLPASVQARAWRWGGFLTDYLCAEPPRGGSSSKPDRPAILLVHGFGAFSDHWRSNIGPLAAAGYRVFAPTLPGFGRSEKVSMPYSQVLWGNFLRDFITQVIGCPVVIAGNSIGGFIATAVAADHPSLVKGLVLLNSAGPIQAQGFAPEAWARQADKMLKSPSPRWLAEGISAGLMWYLERTVPSTLRWLYPINPSRTQGWLSDEICRAAADVGARDVFASVFYLPPPRPLNWLITQKYNGRVLILQGVLDPLNDAKGRARELGTLCGDLAEVIELQAGHCPHDEVPHQVNRAILDWLERVVLPAARRTAVVSSA